MKNIINSGITKEIKIIDEHMVIAYDIK